MIVLPKKENFSPLFHSVGCICRFRNRILLLKRKAGKSYPLRWGIPTGKRLPGETVIKTIIRELYEETHILCSVENLKFIDSFQIVTDNMDFLYDLFVLELKYEPEIILNENEHTTYKWLFFPELDDYDLVPDVKETVAIGLNRKKSGVQLNLFTGEPDNAEHRINLFDLQDEFTISHQNFKEHLDFGKKWYVTYGAPGVGKTTVLKEMEKICPELLVESKDILRKSMNFKEFLHKAFTEQEHRFFFHFQMEILQLRFWQCFYSRNGSFVDEGIFNPLAYTKALFTLKWIDKYVFDSFFRNYNSYQAILVPPARILYFHSSTDTLMKRIRKRGRPHEQQYSRQYLEALNDAFDETAVFLKEKMGYDVTYIQTEDKKPDVIAQEIWQDIAKKGI